MRYEDDGYFWINDMSNIMVMHPIKPALEGTDLAGLKDPTGKFFFQEFIKVVKADGEGYVDYYWPKPGAEEPVLKYSHVEGFAPWGWIVGTGVYGDDLAALFRQNATTTAVTLGLGALAILLYRLCNGSQRGEPDPQPECDHAGDCPRGCQRRSARSRAQGRGRRNGVLGSGPA
jgi:hypothetical protein